MSPTQICNKICTKYFFQEKNNIDLSFVPERKAFPKSWDHVIPLFEKWKSVDKQCLLWTYYAFPLLAGEYTESFRREIWVTFYHDGGQKVVAWFHFQPSSRRGYQQGQGQPHNYKISLYKYLSIHSFFIRTKAFFSLKKLIKNQKRLYFFVKNYFAT